MFVWWCVWRTRLGCPWECLRHFTYFTLCWNAWTCCVSCSIIHVCPSRSHWISLFGRLLSSVCLNDTMTDINNRCATGRPQWCIPHLILSSQWNLCAIIHYCAYLFISQQSSGCIFWPDKARKSHWLGLKDLSNTKVASFEWTNINHFLPIYLSMIINVHWCTIIVIINVQVQPLFFIYYRNYIF